MSSSAGSRQMTFDVRPDFVVPDLTTALPAGARVERSHLRLRTDYYDTRDHALLASRITLRRTTGSDDGWQLTLPGSGDRESLRLPVIGRAVPREMQRLLLGVRRGQSLVQVARVSTVRTASRVFDGQSRPVADIVDDVVQATSGGETVTAATWRRIEIGVAPSEDGVGSDELELLRALRRSLRRAGARSTVASSRLAREILAPAPTKEAPTNVAPPKEASTKKASSKKASLKKASTTTRAAKNASTKRRSGKARQLTAGDVVARYLAEQQEAILTGDLALRRDDLGVVHSTRVATRRMRSTLRTFAPLFDADRAASLDGELRWYAELLGQVRDRQVLRARLQRLIGEVDDTLVLGPVAGHVDVVLNREVAERQRLLQKEMTGPRYLALLADIASWVQDLPGTDRAARPAKATTVRLVRRAERTVSTRLRRANRTGDLEQLHGARKAAKRARYAAEAGRPVLGMKAAGSEAKRYRSLQDLLGEHQDSRISAAFLRREGAGRAGVPGENGFTFGLLYEREQANAESARRRARAVARRYR